MNRKLKIAVAVGTLLAASQAMAQVTFYEGEGFRGRAFTAQRSIDNLNRSGFNDRASSAIVNRGHWEVCENSRYEGRCVVLRPGSYDSLRGMGLNDRVSSMRPVKDRDHYDNLAPEPLAAPTYDYRRRPDERVYYAPVKSVRAVVAAADKHCWTERERVREPGRGDRNVAGGIAGAIIGGVLGHQVGSGTGKDVATVGGAVAGAAIGSNQGRDRTRTYDRDVQHCDTAASNNAPEYWDVAYDYRGVAHHVQMDAAPGKTIAVNRNGEPRQ